MSVSTVAATAHAQQPQPVPLLELINSQGDGRLYTLSANEASSAVSRYGFRLETAPVAFFWRAPFAGSQAVYRLRFKVRHSYLLTPNVAERDALVASGRFELEGVVGYVGAMTGPPPPGQTILWRYSKEGQGWPLAVESRRGALEAQGFHRDGPVGYVFENLPPTPPAPPPPPPGDPCDRTPTDRGLRISLAARGSRRAGRSRVVALRRGARLRVRGRLKSANGGSIAGAAICVTRQRAGRRARRSRVGTLTTDRFGRFTYKLRAKGSHRFVFVYRGTGGATSAALVVRVRDRVSHGLRAVFTPSPAERVVVNPRPGF